MHGAAAPGKPNAERIMILNHKEAIAYLVRDVAALPVDESTIRTLHYLLADSLVAPELAGHIRDESVRVSGFTYAPLEGRERLTRLLGVVFAKARAITDPFEQGFFLLVHISYLQPFIDVNKRTAGLASIIPLIKGDYVPQSFVDADQDSYLKAAIAVYEFNEVGPLADVYAWSYRRSCDRFDTTVMAVGFDEIAALYRTQRRAMVTDLVRSKILPDKVNRVGHGACPGHRAASAPGKIHRLSQCGQTSVNKGLAKPRGESPEQVDMVAILVHTHEKHRRVMQACEYEPLDLQRVQIHWNVRLQKSAGAGPFNPDTDAAVRQVGYAADRRIYCVCHPVCFVVWKENPELLSAGP